MERKEGNVLLKTHSTHFILRLYGIRHMVKDHSDNERGNPMPPWAHHHAVGREATKTASIT